MSKVAISIKNLSKEYVINKGGKKRKFKALDNINLEVEEGKVTGLIGANGAGKSTLLKILSRITYPSSGEVIVNGRLASLLEVGTGFHPELSGRENIFLNGSILGMNKSEIRMHFDEIVDFSGVEDFLDTPVKHYSSGMYVRLAFSVAAHLNTEILLIDEVLAVGDAEFQRKCLQKMNDATKLQNRTVVFVSHNISVARSLCDSIVLLDKGRIKMQGDARDVTDFYLKSLQSISLATKVSERKDRIGNGEAMVRDIKITDPASKREGILISGESAMVEVFFNSEISQTLADVNFELNIHNSHGNFLTMLSNKLVGKNFPNISSKASLRCFVKKLPLMAGKYYITTKLFVNGHIADEVDRAINFEVLVGDYYNSGSFRQRYNPGVLIDQEWDPG